MEAVAVEVCVQLFELREIFQLEVFLLFQAAVEVSVEVVAVEVCIVWLIKLFFIKIHHRLQVDAVEVEVADLGVVEGAAEASIRAHQHASSRSDISTSHAKTISC